MQSLSGRYREGLSVRIDALKAARALLEERPADAVESIKRIAHSLKGSGGTYGFPEISAAAAAVGEASIAALPAAIEQLLATLRAVVESKEGQKVAVLVIEDDPDISFMLQTALAASNREILVAETAAQAEAILVEREVSLIVLDLALPDSDGRDLLVRLRERPATAALPIIVLTAQGGPQPTTECLALGADDYFEKPFDPIALSLAISAKLQRSAELIRESRQDLLTGLPNRAAFGEAFERARLLAARLKQPLALAIMDLDGFKFVNDRYGHIAGDEILRRAAAIIASSLRKSDLLARWGGDEFVALFPNTDPAGAALALDKARVALRSERLAAPDGDPLEIGLSGGVADVDVNARVEDAVAEADRFLYLAKGAGRNRVVSRADEGAPPATQ
jgi:two-component system, cell cycle response regulator